MPYNPELANRIRAHLTGTPGLDEKKMFGGIGWTIGGHMATGAHNDGRLMVRSSPEDFPGFITEPGAAGMVHGGRIATGWVLVDAPQVAEDAELHRWVDRGRAYARSLPPKG